MKTLTEYNKTPRASLNIKLALGALIFVILFLKAILSVIEVNSVIKHALDE